MSPAVLYDLALELRRQARDQVEVEVEVVVIITDDQRAQVEHELCRMRRHLDNLTRPPTKTERH